MRVYIAGPIAGHPNANRAAFTDAADRLRAIGHDPVNPHAVAPQQHDGDCPPGSPGGEGAQHAAPCYMRTDLIAMLSCDAIYLLPGWQQSEGARIEYLVAVHVCGLDVLNADTYRIPEPPRSVRAAFELADPAEVQRLRRWKAEATEVILGLQDVGKALGLRPGERITGESATEAAKQLSARADAAEAEVDKLRGKVSYWRAMAEEAADRA